MVHPQELQYIRTENLPPHPTLTWALGNFAVKYGMRALDLGCGAGRDTRALVAAGFTEVVALDQCPIFEEYVLKRIPPDDQARVTITCDSYQDSYPRRSFDLINAQLTLSHNPRAMFDRVMAVTRQRLKSGGLFVGNFFGDRHPYNHPGAPFTFLTRQEIKDLFAGMSYLRLDERDEEGPSPYADERWHWFDVVVKKT